MLSRASSLLFGHHSPVRGRVCSPVVGVEATTSVSELQCGIGRTGALPLGEEPLSIPLQRLSNSKSTVWCCLSPFVWAHSIQCCWHCHQPHLSHGSASNWPRCPSGTVLRKPPVQIHRHRSTEVRYQVHSSRA